jgi:hypothetical protein
MGTAEFERLVRDVKKATLEDAGDARAEISRRVKVARGGRKDAAGRYLPVVVDGQEYGPDYHTNEDARLKEGSVQLTVHLRHDRLELVRRQSG